MAHNDKLLSIIGHGLSANPSSFDEIFSQLARYAEAIHCDVTDGEWDLIEGVINEPVATVGGAA